MTDQDVIKRCACCGATYTAEAWARLKLVGYGGDEVERLELRNCTCRSTLAIVVHEVPEAAPLRQGEG